MNALIAAGEYCVVQCGAVACSRVPCGGVGLWLGGAYSNAVGCTVQGVALAWQSWSDDDATNCQEVTARTRIPAPALHTCILG